MANFAAVFLWSVAFAGVIVAEGAKLGGRGGYGEDGEAVAPKNEDSDYFTAAWKKEFTKSQLARQLKWKLADDQPEGSPYEVRDYAPSWFVSASTPCLNQTASYTLNYIKAYLYMDKQNSMYQKFKLTYPIINKIGIGEKSSDSTGKGDRYSHCGNHYSVNFHLPHVVGDDDQYNNPPKSKDSSVVTSEQTTTVRRFVRTYEDVFQPSSVLNCNLEAIELIGDLKDKSFEPSSFYCAVYEAGKSGKIKFEVWFDEQ